MTTYPPAKRDDGVCARDGCDKPVPTAPPKTMPKSLRGMFLEASASEQFCSSSCCRAVYGCPARTSGSALGTPVHMPRGEPTQLQDARAAVSDGTRKKLAA